MRSLPTEVRRGEAVGLACRVLLAAEVRALPPDPGAVARQLGIPLMTYGELAKLGGESPDRFTRRTLGKEAFAFRAGKEYGIAYDDGVRSPERIRFSVFHEAGHILLGHFEWGSMEDLPEEARRILEAEADIFARNFLCPPPVAELMRGNREDPRRGELFCLSRAAWRVRLETLEGDGRLLDPHLADRVRIQFREYMFGRRCRECGAVFTDEGRLDRCPECGSRYLKWNPGMESRERAAEHYRTSGTLAEDLKPRMRETGNPDLTGYWELLRKESRQP